MYGKFFLLSKNVEDANEEQEEHVIVQSTEDYGFEKLQKVDLASKDLIKYVSSRIVKEKLHELLRPKGQQLNDPIDIECVDSTLKLHIEQSRLSKAGELIVPASAVVKEDPEIVK